MQNVPAITQHLSPELAQIFLEGLPENIRNGLEMRAKTMNYPVWAVIEMARCLRHASRTQAISMKRLCPLLIVSLNSTSDRVVRSRRHRSHAIAQNIATIELTQATPPMPESLQTSRLQQAIDTVESLSLEEQNLVVEILLKRLQRKRREQLLQEIGEVRQEAAQGIIKFGSVEDFLKELDA